MTLELNGAGVVIRWSPPSSEIANGSLKYNLYRVDMADGSEVSDTSLYTALQSNIPDVIALDSQPSGIVCRTAHPAHSFYVIARVIILKISLIKEIESQNHELFTYRLYRAGIPTTIRG